MTAIWELQSWGHAEFTEQAVAEIAFAKVMGVHYQAICPHELNGMTIAGYRVRRAPLVLVPDDRDDDLFVAVRPDIPNKQAMVLGWLRGGDGKRPEYFRGDHWLIPDGALTPMEH
jgi:hypothetical protein